MRAVSRLFGFAAASALIAGSAHAQSCNGFSSLASAKMNVAGSAWFADGASSFGGHLNSRLGSSAFLGLGVSTTSQDGVDDSALGFTGNLGLMKSTGSGIEWCPQAMVGYTKGPGDGVSGLDLGAGLGIAKALSSSGSFSLVPFGGVAFTHSKFSFDVAGVDVSSSDDYFEIGAGVGFRFSNGMQISPQLRKSLQDGADVVFGVTVSFPFGKTM